MHCRIVEDGSMASQIHDDIFYRMYIIQHSKLLKFTERIELEASKIECAGKIAVVILRYNRFEHHHSKHHLNPAMISHDHCTCFTTNIEKLNTPTTNIRHRDGNYKENLLLSASNNIKIAELHKDCKP